MTENNTQTATPKVDGRRRRGPRGPRQYTSKHVVRTAMGIRTEYGLPLYATYNQPRSKGLVFDEELGMLVEREQEENSSTIAVRIGDPKGSNHMFLEGDSKSVIMGLRAVRTLLRFQKTGSTEDPGLVNEDDDSDESTN